MTQSNEFFRINIGDMTSLNSHFSGKHLKLYTATGEDNLDQLHIFFKAMDLSEQITYLFNLL